MTRRLTDIASVIRSKNAGPYELTLDIIFTDEEIYRQVVERQVISRQLISGLYRVPESDIIALIAFPPARASPAAREMRGPVIRRPGW